jgi:hypothetical protein
MRKIIIVAGLLLGASLFSNTPAQAWIGCVCVKAGAPAMCAKGPVECTFGGGGVCVLPCDYQEPKMTKGHHRHAMKKKKK